MNIMDLTVIIFDYYRQLAWDNQCANSDMAGVLSHVAYE